MRLSVIVPVYNTGKFLYRCLDSLLRQGMNVGEYEIICVNDGSTDNGAAILAEYLQKYPETFKIITQANKGTGVAKNVGMKVAKGDYIGFVDSDDYVIDNAFKYLLEHSCEEYVDVVHFMWKLISTDGTSLYDPDAKPDGEVVFDGDGAEAYNRQNLPYVWAKLYRRSFLERNGICFETPLMEDDLFNFEVFHYHPHFRIVSSNIYRYEKGNANSLLTTIDKEKVKKQLEWLLFVHEKMKKYLKEENGEWGISARRSIGYVRTHYFNKMLKAHFTWREWLRYTMPIKSQKIHKLDVPKESSFIERAIVYLKNGAAESYAIYIFVAFGVNVIFARWIRPRIIKSAL